MSLKQCHECGGSVNTDAKRDINKPLNWKSIWKWILFAFVLMIIIGIVYVNYDDSSHKKEITSPENDRKIFIDKHFSAWDGSHRGLEKYIKDAMHDQQSYEHVETRYWDRGDYLLVQTVFRGKNAFGAVVKNQVRAKVGLNGEVLEIINQE